MINIEKVRVSNFEGAFRGLRNPMNSWEKSDSWFGLIDEDNYHLASYVVAKSWTNLYGIAETEPHYDDCNDKTNNWLLDVGCLYYYPDLQLHEVAFLGPNDMKLAQRMIAAGTDESKFMRQIGVSFDLTLPLYVWKEFDTYKVGTVANSCSTMHKITSKPFSKEDFSFDNPDAALTELPLDDYIKHITQIEDIINHCEWLRQRFVETKDKRYWRALIQIFPESFNQKRTITLNYQVLRAQYFARRQHKLTEWREYCEWIKSLPYGKELICYEK